MLMNVKIFLDKHFFYDKLSAIMDAETLMTITELAGYLKVTRRTIYEWLKRRKIPAVKLVGQWRFKKDKIDQWLERQTERSQERCF
jgi:excisionase family DNA binding protein